EQVRVIVDELRLRNFRAFENARLSLSDLTFLVGRNGAGKSSLLDAMDLLREAVSDSLENALDRRGGVQKVRRATIERGRKPPLGIAIVVRFSFPGGRSIAGVYGFELRGESTGASHIRECLKLSSSEA